MLNNQIFFFFYNLAHQSRFLGELIVFFAHIFPYLVIVGAFIFLVFHHEIFYKEKPFKEIKQKIKEIFFVSFSIFLGWLFSVIFKIVFLIPRPFLFLADVDPLFWVNGFSFPSGHSAFFMALAIAIFLYHKKIGFLFIFFALLIGIARIISGVHYPIDILVGYFSGGLISYLLIKFSKK
jgi:undecaprenyl-diphosphatase